MKNKILKLFIIGLTAISIITATSMITQDDQCTFNDEVNKLLESGVSKEEILEYIGNNNDIIKSTQMLREAQASGYFENKKNSAPARL